MFSPSDTRPAISGTNQHGVTLNHLHPCDRPIYLKSPLSDYSVLRRDDRARHVAHRGNACREPSGCSRRQKGEAQHEREAEREEKKDKTVSAPKVGNHLCDCTLLLHSVGRASMSDTHADEST